MKKISVFLCLYEDRGDFQARTLYAWKKLRREDPRIQVKFIIHAQMMARAQELLDDDQLTALAIFFDGPPSEFQRSRRVAAECMSTSPIYVCADDDCVPEAGSVTRAIEIMEKPEHAEFAVLSLMPSNCTINPWTPEPPYVAIETQDVMEHHNVGGVRFCRKGILPQDADDWTPQPPVTPFGWKYDAEHAAMIRERGYRCGYFRNICMRHLGER